MFFVIELFFKIIWANQYIWLVLMLSPYLKGKMKGTITILEFKMESRQI